MEILAKVSKGTVMDQIYIPKIRTGFPNGSFVLIKPVNNPKAEFKPYFHNLNSIEPVKLEIITLIFLTINNLTENENIVITGSFLDQGFCFNDIDIIIIGEKLNEKQIKKEIEEKIKIKIHLISLTNKEFKAGLATDPLYQLMLSKCISKKRFHYNIKKEINYKILDLHLLQSKLLISNFDILNGHEKYNLVRNLISILMFYKNKVISVEKVNKEIENLFSIKVQDIKNNLANNILEKYKSIYNKLSKEIIENASKQK